MWRMIAMMQTWMYHDVGSTMKHVWLVIIQLPASSSAVLTKTLWRHTRWQTNWQIDTAYDLFAFWKYVHKTSWWSIKWFARKIFKGYCICISSNLAFPFQLQRCSRERARFSSRPASRHHSPPRVQGSAGGRHGAAKRERPVSVRARPAQQRPSPRVGRGVGRLGHLQSHGTITSWAPACAVASRAAAAPRTTREVKMWVAITFFIQRL